MLVLRIEDSNGFGPYYTENRVPFENRYRWELEIERGRYLPDGNERHIHPDCEPFWHKTTKDHYYGFMKKEHLDIWYTPVELGLFESVGVNVNIYSVDDKHVLQGERQLAFLKDKAELIGRYTRRMRKLF